VYSFLIIKRKAEDIILFPLILLGKILSGLFTDKKEYSVYFFFPFYHIGGAEKVHAQVANASGGKDCIIYFTRKSANNLMKAQFENSNCVIKDISRYTDNKLLYFLNIIWRGILSAKINRQHIHCVVFNGQCNFAYKISPWIKKDIRQIELIHSLNTFSYIRIPYLPFITSTIMISQKRIEDHHQLYKKKGIPESFLNRINYIPNAIKLPDLQGPKQMNPFRILFSGRGGMEKRLHLITTLASEFKDNMDIVFEIMGDVSEVVNLKDFPFMHFYGPISDTEEIHKIYTQAHIVMITSSTEGFPLSIIEGMSDGCAIIATPVGDIPYHIKNGINGFLFSTVQDESIIIKEGINYINELKTNSELFNKISSNNINYAREHFSIEKFNLRYREIILNNNK
jgi:glycosyltransferase involved in cell wall biosynthesis